MIKNVTVQTFAKNKFSGKKITMLTAYDYSTAKYIDEAGVDAVLVGDSLAMVALGYETTHMVTMQEMLIFTAAVARGVKKAFVATDMPFLSYNVSKEEAVKNAGEFIRAGAHAVKIEGGSDYTVELVEHLTNSGIPVMSHLGFTPQFLHTIGGYNVQGKSVDDTMQILEQAKKLEAAGAFSLVLEMVPEESAKFITENLTIPTIGIGAGRFCSGQILVCDDVFGKYSDFEPKFAEKYADMRELITSAAKKYADDVVNGVFPAAKHVFNLSELEVEKLYDPCCK